MKRELIVFWILLCLSFTGHTNEILSFQIYEPHNIMLGGYEYKPPMEAEQYKGLPHISRMRQQDIYGSKIEIDGNPHYINTTLLDYWNTSYPTNSYPRRFCFINPADLGVKPGLHVIRGWPDYTDANWTEEYLLNVWSDGQCRLMRAKDLTWHLELFDFMEPDNIIDLVKQPNHIGLHLSQRREHFNVDDLSYIYETLNSMKTDQMLTIVKRDDGYNAHLLEREQLLFLKGE